MNYDDESAALAYQQETERRRYEDSFAFNHTTQGKFMPSIDSMVPSKSNYLKKEDVGTGGRNLTIASFDQEEIGQDGEKELKLIVRWQQQDFLPMVVNKENASRLKMTLKTDDTDQMIGKTVNVYHDEFVSFGGKQVGGLRIRPPAHAAAQQQLRSPAPQQRRAAPPSEPDAPESPPLEAYRNDIPY